MYWITILSVVALCCKWDPSFSSNITPDPQDLETEKSKLLTRVFAPESKHGKVIVALKISRIRSSKRRVSRGNPRKHLPAPIIWPGAAIDTAPLSRKNTGVRIRLSGGVGFSP